MYKIVFDGQLAEGFAVGQVKKNLAKLFKLSDERAASIFAGQAVVLKKNADAETAKKYKAVLLKAGAVTKILPMAPTQAAGTKAAAKPSTKTAAKPAGSGTAAQSWSLSATDGEQLLREEERTKFVEREIDLSHINLVSSFLSDEIDETNAAPAAPAVDTSHISVAEVGTTIGDSTSKPAPVEVPELNASIAEVGATIGDGSNAPEPVAVADLDASLAPVGADLVDAQPEPETPDIDISHIKLS